MRRATRPTATIAALIFALSVFCFTLFFWRSFGGPVPFGAEGYRVTVHLGAEASNLFPNAEARISGIRVGEVRTVRATGRQLEAELEIDARYAPLPADTRAILRSKTLLGEAYLELTPGTRSGPELADGAVLPRASVEEAQGLDRVLSAFDARTRRELRTFLEGVGDTLDGRGEEANAAFGRMPGASEDLRRLADVLDRQGGPLRGLVRDVGATLRAVGERPGDARAIAVEGSRLLAATAARDRDLRATLRELPATLAGVEALSGEVEAASADAGPALRALRPAGPALEPALREARTLAPALDGALRALRTTAGHARRGLPAGTRLLDAARPLMGVLHPAGRELVPLIQTLHAYREDAVTALAASAAVSNATYPTADGKRQHVLRGLLMATNELPYGLAAPNATHRDNPYLRPGGMADLGRGGLRAFDCRHAGGSDAVPPIGTGAPPCLQQEPFSIAGGPAGSFPRVERGGG